MTRKHLSVILYFFVILITGCDSKQDRINKSIHNLKEKYPQLNLSTNPEENNYELIRSVKNGDYGFEIYLYSQCK